MGEGGGGARSTKNIYSRKGKLNLKKFNAGQLTLKNFMPWPKKIHTRNLIAKSVLRLENPPPPTLITFLMDCP